MDATSPAGPPPTSAPAGPAAAALRGEPLPGFLPSRPPLDEPTALRLIWPQWQGAGYDNAPALVPELPVDIARRGYVAGALAGKGDAEVLGCLPATIDPARIALAGLHAWEPDVTEHVRGWGITAFTPTTCARPRRRSRPGCAPPAPAAWPSTSTSSTRASWRWAWGSCRAA